MDGRRLVLRDDWTGTVEQVNTAPAALAARRRLPAGADAARAPPSEGEAINVDGDRAAAMVAAAFGAEALVILSNVPGLLRSFPDESTLIREIPRARADEFMRGGRRAA